MWNRRKNGEIYPEWQTITAVKNDAGKVSHYVCVFSDITEKKDAEGKIQAMAFYDPLTKLPNRRLLLDRFDQELATAKRHKQFGAVIFLDLDHFKLLNDSQGHLVGDELLIQVAKRLVSVLREEDTPARLGGDEFVVLLHANSESLSTVADQAWVVAEKIKEKLNEPFMLNQYQHQISTSIGITLFPDHHKSPEVILQQADTAMYRSKTSGRNAVSFFHSSMQEAADLRLNLEQDLRTAIDNGRFILCYQPQVDAGGSVFSAEALIRWEHLNKGILLPVDFIPVAEESSLILGIGRWVLLEACNQIKAWRDAGVRLPHVSVNVSSRQFRQHDFVVQVKHAIDSSGIAAHLLGIELTESVMIVDINDTVTKMKALKALGISIAVDDFGTGYSSLMYLKQLPIDALKIDQGFVRDILTDASDAVIVETIISMAQHLNLHVVAEGVETAEQLALLKQQGCPAFQGYYFSRPLLAAEYAEKYFNPCLETSNQ
jgi:diguanylate cyclase (GGDEF)-like protein